MKFSPISNERHRWNAVAESHWTAIIGTAVESEFEQGSLVTSEIDMTSVKVQATVGSDGILRLETPVELPSGIAEVVVTFTTASKTSTLVRSPAVKARSGLFVGRDAEGAIDIESALREINDGWKSKLTDAE